MPWWSGWHQAWFLLTHVALIHNGFEGFCFEYLFNSNLILSMLWPILIRYVSWEKEKQTYFALVNCIKQFLVNKWWFNVKSYEFALYSTPFSWMNKELHVCSVHYRVYLRANQVQSIWIIFEHVLSIELSIFLSLLPHSNRRIFIIKFQTFVTLPTPVYELLMLLPKDEHAHPRCATRVR